MNKTKKLLTVAAVSITTLGVGYYIYQRQKKRKELFEKNIAKVKENMKKKDSNTKYAGKPWNDDLKDGDEVFFPDEDYTEDIEYEEDEIEEIDVNPAEMFEDLDDDSDEDDDIIDVEYTTENEFNNLEAIIPNDDDDDVMLLFVCDENIDKNVKKFINEFLPFFGNSKPNLQKIIQDLKSNKEVLIDIDDNELEADKIIIKTYPKNNLSYKNLLEIIDKFDEHFTVVYAIIDDIDCSGIELPKNEKNLLNYVSDKLYDDNGTLLVNVDGLKEILEEDDFEDSDESGITICITPMNKIEHIKKEIERSYLLSIPDDCFIETDYGVMCDYDSITGDRIVIKAYNTQKRFCVSEIINTVDYYITKEKIKVDIVVIDDVKGMITETGITDSDTIIEIIKDMGHKYDVPIITSSQLISAIDNDDETEDNSSDSKFNSTLYISSLQNMNKVIEEVNKKYNFNIDEDDFDDYLDCIRYDHITEDFDLVIHVYKENISSDIIDEIQTEYRNNDILFEVIDTTFMDKEDDSAETDEILQEEVPNNSTNESNIDKKELYEYYKKLFVNKLVERYGTKVEDELIEVALKLSTETDKKIISRLSHNLITLIYANGRKDDVISEILLICRKYIDGIY